MQIKEMVGRVVNGVLMKDEGGWEEGWSAVSVQYDMITKVQYCVSFTVTVRPKSRYIIKASFTA